MKCLRCQLVNPTTTDICKRCLTPLPRDAAAPAGNHLKIYRDTRFLVIENTTALPRRCYKCNSREIAQMRRQTLQYTPPLEELLDVAVGMILPIAPSLARNKKTIDLELSFCRRHRSLRGIGFKIGVGMMIFSVLCFAAGIIGDKYANFSTYSIITSVAAFCLGILFLLVRDTDIVSHHKYQSSYFWVKGFGEEYLSSFPNWTNSGRR